MPGPSRLPAPGEHPELTDVAIVGAGPVGLALAVELTRRGIRCIVLEQDDVPSEMPRAHGLVGQIVTALARRRVLAGVPGAHAFPVPRFPFGPVMLRLNPLRPGALRVLPVPQRQLEQVLEQRATAEGAIIRRGRAVSGFADDGERVTVEIQAPTSTTTLQARYLVGCDGAHSLVRHHAGIGFPGTTSDEIARIGQVTIGALTPVKNGYALADGRRLTHFLPCRTATGSVTLSPASSLDPDAPPDSIAVTTHEPRGEYEPAPEITVDDLRDSVRRVLGVTLPLSNGRWLRSTVANSRLADRFRVGRVFLAGDAAHVFSAGGSSLNIGMLDALALAPRLAAAVIGNASPETLEGYHVARFAAGQEAIVTTRAQAALSAPGADADALRDVLTAAFRTRNPQRYLARRLIGR